MRPVREITPEEDNFRVEPYSPDEPNVKVIKRDPVEPEPVGTIIMCAFRIVRYDPDCDGSLLARLEQVNKNGEATGWYQSNLGLYPNAHLVVTQDELTGVFQPKEEAGIG